MIKDTGLRKLEKKLYDYIEEIGYELKTKPYTTNMSLDDNGAFVTLPEHQVFATAENPDGLTVSLSIIPTRNAIFIEDELVRNLD